MHSPTTHGARSEHDQYVEKIDWLMRTGREDLIDEIADQYERPVSRNASASRPARARHLRSVA